MKAAAAAIEILGGNPFITLKDLNLAFHTSLSYLRKRWPIHWKAWRIRTLKKARDVTAERSTTEVKEYRYIYAEWLTSLQVVNSHKF